MQITNSFITNIADTLEGEGWARLGLYEEQRDDSRALKTKLFQIVIFLDKCYYYSSLKYMNKTYGPYVRRVICHGCGYDLEICQI